jgi:hypothetical protein
MVVRLAVGFALLAAALGLKVLWDAHDGDRGKLHDQAGQIAANRAQIDALQQQVRSLGAEPVIPAATTTSTTTVPPSSRPASTAPASSPGRSAPTTGAQQSPTPTAAPTPPQPPPPTTTTTTVCLGQHLVNRCLLP